ncbi:MAG: DUF4249 domain-containing protein [Ekhidna sp.]|nr:DUF4249 domain-containing protein [Ekhidna sp.]
MDQDEPESVSGATVWITDTESSRIDFVEQENGRYVSTEFGLEANNAYTLHIETVEGKRYQSTAENLPAATQIDEIFGSYVNNPSNESDEFDEGIQFFINASSTDPNSEVFNVRISYEEDYVITVPYASPFIFSSEAGIIDRDSSIQTCYRNLQSNELLIGSTSGQSQNQLLDFPVRLVRPSEPNLRFRYSLTVRQFSITPQAYRYYQDLKENNESGGGFPDRQKGSIIGNIVNIEDPEDVVLGYFEVAQVSQARAFFTPSMWRDEGFRPDPIFRSCEYTMVADSVFTEDVRNGLISFAGRNIHAISTSGIFTVLVPEICSDCRFYGTLDKPDFWN